MMKVIVKLNLNNHHNIHQKSNYQTVFCVYIFDEWFILMCVKWLIPFFYRILNHFLHVSRYANCADLSLPTFILCTKNWTNSFNYSDYNEYCRILSSIFLPSICLCTLLWCSKNEFSCVCLIILYLYSSNKNIHAKWWKKLMINLLFHYQRIDLKEKKEKFVFWIGALCYGEFAARIPRAGSSYIFIYESIGEIVPFLVVKSCNLNLRSRCIDKFRS
jgi:FlaA1/EpsC-like NDP-sugar epimerase